MRRTKFDLKPRGGRAFIGLQIERQIAARPGLDRIAAGLREQSRREDRGQRPTQHPFFNIAWGRREAAADSCNTTGAGWEPARRLRACPTLICERINSVRSAASAATTLRLRLR